MKELIRAVEKSINLHGSHYLTSSQLLFLLKEVEKTQNKNIKKQEQFFRELEAECTDPNG